MFHRCRSNRTSILYRGRPLASRLNPTILIPSGGGPSSLGCPAASASVSAAAAVVVLLCDSAQEDRAGWDGGPPARSKVLYTPASFILSSTARAALIVLARARRTGGMAAAAAADENPPVKGDCAKGSAASKPVTGWPVIRLSSRATGADELENGPGYDPGANRSVLARSRRCSKADDWPGGVPPPDAGLAPRGLATTDEER